MEPFTPRNTSYPLLVCSTFGSSDIYRAARKPGSLKLRDKLAFFHRPPHTSILYLVLLRVALLVAPLLAVVLADLALDLVLVVERLTLALAALDDLAGVDHGGRELDATTSEAPRTVRPPFLEGLRFT